MSEAPSPQSTDPHSTETGPSRRSTLLLGLAGAMLAVGMIGAGALFWLTQGPDAALGIGGPFSLVDGDGKPVTDKSFRGKYMLVYFGYTFCPDVCPTTLNQVADALDRLGTKADRLAPIFITVDPKRDTPAAVKQFAAAFSPRLVGLTGSAEQVGAAARAYRVYYAERRTGDGPNDYAMDHSSILYLMGPDGRFIAPIRAEETGEQIAADLTRLMK
jgi:protein SCO1/2